MKSLRKRDLTEYVWFCALCGASHRSHGSDTTHFRADAEGELQGAGWKFVSLIAPDRWPPDVLDERDLFFCPKHAESARLVQLVVTILRDQGLISRTPTA